MQNQINNIEIKNPLFQELKVQNIVVEKQIYRLRDRCDVKFVRIEQKEGTNPILPEQIKKGKYALKVIYKQKIIKTSDNYSRQYDAIYNQIIALYIINHPNVIKLFWHHEQQNAIYLLMEYGGVKLLSYSSKQNLDEEQVKQMFTQICLGVNEIHSKNIMHRDLCLENILISTVNNNLIKIIDFDHAIQFTGGRESMQGLLTSMAPEIYYQKRYNSKADIWSLGIILYQLFHKRNPFVDENVAYEEGDFIAKRDKLQFMITNGSISEDAKRLIQRMLSLNPEKRPSIKEILNSKWLTGNEQQPQIQRKTAQNLSSDDKKTMQIPNKDRKQISGFSLSEKNDTQNIGMKLNEFERDSHKQDDFMFDKMINKMTMENSLKQIEQRLCKLMRIRMDELVRKKQFMLKYLAIEKKKIQKDKELFKK